MNAETEWIIRNSEKGAVQCFEERIEELRRNSERAIREMEQGLERMKESMVKQESFLSPTDIVASSATTLNYIVPNVRVDLLFKAASYAEEVRSLRKQNDLLK